MLRKDLLPTITKAVTEAGNVSSAHPLRGHLEISPSNEGLEAWVTIRLPVPAFESHSEQQRRAEILQRARRLIDHIFQAEGRPSSRPEAEIRAVWTDAPIDPGYEVEAMRWTVTADGQAATDKGRS